MAYFNFSALVRKYMSEITLITTSEGSYKGGEWVKGEKTRTTMQGAVISMRESRVIRSEGTYTQQDKALYMLEPLSDALKAAKLVHNGKLYSVSSELENSEFTGVWAYALKYISVFDGGDADG